jgi:hypothetical protein
MGVAPYMVPSVDQQDAHSKLIRDPFGEYSASKSRANYEPFWAF